MANRLLIDFNCVELEALNSEQRRGSIETILSKFHRVRCISSRSKNFALFFPTLRTYSRPNVTTDAEAVSTMFSPIRQSYLSASLLPRCRKLAPYSRRDSNSLAKLNCALPLPPFFPTLQITRATFSRLYSRRVAPMKTH